MSQEINFGMVVIESLEGLAHLTLNLGEPVRAAKLQSWTDKDRETVGIPRTNIEKEQSARLVSAIQSQIGEALWQTVCAEGQAMSREEAIQFALAQ